MKKMNGISSICIIILCVLTSVQMKAQTQKVFVGYINNYPVFDAFEEKKVYVLKDTIEFLFDYPQTYSFVAIKNDFICYTEKTKETTDIILFSDNKEKRYSFNKIIGYVVLGDDGTIFFNEKPETIKCIINDEIKDTKLKGYCIDIVGGFLYYSQTHDSDIIYPDMDIFEVDTKTLYFPRKLIENVAAETTVIIPNRKYIYDEKLIDGGFNPILYNIDNGIYKRIFVDEKFAGTPFYSFQKDALIFYDPTTLELKVMDIYTGW